MHESKILEDSERSEDTESNASHHASEAPALSEQAARPTDLLTLLKSRKVLLTLIVFIVPSFAENAFQALSSYFLARRGPDQTFQQVLLSIFPGQIFRAVLFALFVPWAFSFLQRRFGIRQAEIDSWIIRGSLLLLALSGAFVTSSSSFAARVIGEQHSHLDPTRICGSCYLGTDDHSCHRFCHGLRLENVVVVIHYFPSGTQTPRATLWCGSGCGGVGTAYCVAHSTRFCGQTSQQGRPMA